MIEEFIKSSLPFFGQWGLVLFFFTSLFEGWPIIGAIVPGATLVIFGGFLAKKQVLHFSYLLAVVTFAAFLGDIVGFYIGKKYGFNFLKKYGKYLLLNESRLHKLKSIFQKHPGKSIIFGRFNSITRSFASFVAGATDISSRVFLPLSFLSAFMWAFSHILVGFIFGKWIERISRYIGLFFFVAIVVGIALVYLYKYLNARHHIFKKFHVYTLVSAIFSMFFFFSTLQFVVFNDWMRDLDVFIIDLVRLIQSSIVTSLMFFVTHLADPLNMLLFIGLLVVWLVSKRNYYDACLVAFASVLGTVLTYVVKALTGIQRPSFSLLDTFIGSSFPSGHTTLITILCVSLIVIFTKKFKTSVARHLFFFVNVLTIVLVGFSRVYLGAHFPSDVVAGLSLGVFTVSFSILFFRLVAFVKRWLY